MRWLLVSSVLAAPLFVACGGSHRVLVRVTRPKLLAFLEANS